MRYLEIVYEDNGEQLLKVGVGVGNDPVVKRYCECYIAYLSAVAGGFRSPATVATTSTAAELKKRQAELTKQETQRKTELVEAGKRRWAAEIADLRVTLPERIQRAEEVSIGFAHPDFDEWTMQNVSHDEKIIARCYSANESLVVTNEKVMLLKKGIAKAAVSASGGGSGASTVGALGLSHK